jgi:hypothetical protein
VRRDVLGADYVDGSIARPDDFNAAFRIATEVFKDVDSAKG